MLEKMQPPANLLFFFYKKYLKHHLHRIEDNPSNSSVRDKYHQRAHTTKYTSSSSCSFSSMFFPVLRVSLLKPPFYLHLIVLFGCYVILCIIMPSFNSMTGSLFCNILKHPSFLVSNFHHLKRAKNILTNMSNNNLIFSCLGTNLHLFRGHVKRTLEYTFLEQYFSDMK